MSVYDELTALDHGSDIGTTYRVHLNDSGVPVAELSDGDVMPVDYPHSFYVDGKRHWENIPDGVDIVHEFHNSESLTEPRHWEYHLDTYVTSLDPGDYFDVECQPVAWDNDDSEFADVEPTILEGWIMLVRTGKYATPTPGDCAHGVVCVTCAQMLANGESSDYDEFTEDERNAYDEACNRTMSDWGSVTLGHFHDSYSGCSHAGIECTDIECDCARSYFSRTPCSMCDSYLAGEREDVTYWPVGWKPAPAPDTTPAK